MSMNLRRRVLIAGMVATWLIVSVAPPSRAEVGTLEIEAAGPYIMGIIDDPDPTRSRIWRRLSAPGSPRIVLNEQGETNGDGYPAVLYNTFTRTPVVAWARNSPSGFDVVLTHFDGGAWMTPTVLAGSPADERDPFLALDAADGSVHLVYWVDDGTPRVMHRKAPADLSNWSEPVQVSLPGEIAVRPAAVVHDASVRVVYETHNAVVGGIPRQIVLALDTGSGFTSQILATTSHTGENFPEVHSGLGRLWVEWIDDAGEMTWTREQSGGGWDPPSDEAFSDAEERDYFVRGRIKDRALD